MINMPASTQYGVRIPKQKFYENLDISPNLKRLFIDQISTIIWKNKIAATTMNISQGENVTELEVFEIQLKERALDQSILKLIDQQIPYHILFLLVFNGEVQAWIGYKTASPGQHAFKVDAYYHTDWLNLEALTLDVIGFSTDAVYEGFVRQIAGDRLSDSRTSLSDDVERSKRREKLEKEIARLEKQAWGEKQPRKKMEISQHIKALQAEMHNN